MCFTVYILNYLLSTILELISFGRFYMKQSLFICFHLPKTGLELLILLLLAPELAEQLLLSLPLLE